MMKLLFVFFFISNFLFSQNLDLYRKNYVSAVSDKKVCEAMIKDLKDHQHIDIYRAYLGAYQTIWANHVINPISKLNTFKKGKNNLELSIKNSPHNIEIKFLRYTIQKKAPKFLGYYENINNDRLFILSNKRTVTDNVLKELLKNVE